MSFKTAQVTVADSATLIAAARPGRRKITVTNHGATAAYLGAAGVTTATGTLLNGAAGAQVTIETSEAVYGVVAAATQAVSYVETW